MSETARVEVDDLGAAIGRVERGIGLFVWKCNADDPWRVTDWAGVPDDFESVRWIGRVDLYGPAGVENAIRRAEVEVEPPA